jgi:primosomal protein N' (replication factor Y) (superfamily II helicase)
MLTDGDRLAGEGELAGGADPGGEGEAREAGGEAKRRFVEVAVDAPGVPGGRAFTYHLPVALADVVPGEAVLVEYGRRRAVGVVLAETATADRETKPVLARVRSDGPLLPALSLRLARHVAEHYFAPPGLVVRQMLPPGLLERIELIVRLRDDAGLAAGSAGPAAAGSGGGDSPDDLLAAVTAGGADGVAVDDLPSASSRATLLRRLRELEAAGALVMEWRVTPAGGRPREERWLVLTEEGRDAHRTLIAGQRLEGRPLGPRQRALLAELAGSVEAEAEGSAVGESSAADPGPRPSDGSGAAGAGNAARLAERHGASAVTGLARRGLARLEVRTVERSPLTGRADPVRGAMPLGASLTQDQASAAATLAAATEERRHEAVLLEGPTASGKTAVYVAAIQAALVAGRGALVLVPEIAMATPLIDRLRHDLGSRIAILHSGLGDGERADEWRRIRSGAADVVVGTRMAVLAPLGDPGVVVVDEEHDPAYKSDRTPRYQARDLAVELGRLAGAPVVLGSATPDIVMMGRARAGELRHVRLSERATGRGAAVEVVDLRAELAAGNRGLLSAPLVEALTALDREAGERAILVINRRGAATVVLCRDCGHVQVCPECQRPLVLHLSVMALRCHHCGATAPLAKRCPRCESPRIRYLGGGTERVEEEVRARLPGLRVGRLDRDIVERRGAAARVIDAFTSGELDVLVGTSLVTKGLDVPEVTLVGVVSADIALNLPDERAAERTWQLLAQAVGRAGRGERPGRAIIQTYQPEHPAIVAVRDDDASPFVEAELDRRRLYGSPPFGRLIKLTVALEDREAAEAEARRMIERLRERAASSGPQVAVLGPVPAYVARRGGRWRFHVVLRGPDPAQVLDGDPGAPWSVDVDPESLL